MSKEDVGDVWVVVEYEVKMLAATTEVVLDPVVFESLERAVKNAVTESAVLHSRILADVFLSKGRGHDDITLEDLVADWTKRPDGDALRAAVARLKVRYGTAKDAQTPCWVFNKMTAHPTKLRGNSYDYNAVLADLLVQLNEVVQEVEAVTARQFMLSFSRP